MEKSLKLTINNISLARFDFNGFSNSKNWVGHFEKKGDKSDVNCVHQATNLMYEYFKNDWDDFFIMSALFYDDSRNNEEGVDDKYLEIYELSKGNSLLNDNRSDEAEQYFEEKIPLPAKFIQLCFDKEFLLPFVEMVMAMTFGKVVGQICFLINPKLKIALYPHDDIGFGCIDLDENPKVLIDFLMYCNQKDFISYIE